LVSSTRRFFAVFVFLLLTEGSGRSFVVGYRGHLVTVAASKPNFITGSNCHRNFLDWHRINQRFAFCAVSRTSG
jgi:hypothetical protein